MEPFKTHGAFSWNELNTDDPKKAVAFYGERPRSLPRDQGR